MLTTAEFEKYKKKLNDATKELGSLEATRTQLEAHLRLTFGVTIDEAKETIATLQVELPKKEAEFEAEYQAFNEKWKTLMAE